MIRLKFCFLLNSLAFTGMFDRKLINGVQLFSIKKREAGFKRQRINRYIVYSFGINF